MQGIDLVAALGLLVEQVRDQGELVQHQLAHHPSGVTFQHLQCLANPAELLGMSIAAHLQCQPGSKPRIGLAQRDPGLLRKGSQLRPRPLVKSGVRGIGDSLLHHGRVDRHPHETALVYGAGFASGLNGLGQEPFHPFLTNPLAPPRQG